MLVHSTLLVDALQGDLVWVIIGLDRIYIQFSHQLCQSRFLAGTTDNIHRCTHLFTGAAVLANATHACRHGTVSSCAIRWNDKHIVRTLWMRNSCNMGSGKAIRGRNTHHPTQYRNTHPRTRYRNTHSRTRYRNAHPRTIGSSEKTCKKSVGRCNSVVCLME